MVKVKFIINRHLYKYYIASTYGEILKIIIKILIIIIIFDINYNVRQILLYKFKTINVLMKKKIKKVE